MAAVEHDDAGLLRWGLAGSGGAWQAGDFQYGPGVSVHERRLDERIKGCERSNQHGR